MKKIGIALLVILIVIQFIKPTKNISTEVSANAIEQHYNVPDDVKQILKVSCNDCHSNNTYYPWYNNIQPVAWFLNRHVVEGKEHLNFDEFNTYTVKKKKHKLKEVDEVIKENEMPLTSYTLIHRDAVLSANQKEVLTQWALQLAEQIGE